MSHCTVFADHGCSRSLTRQALHRREVLNTLITENIADFTLSGVLHWPVCPQPGSSPLISCCAACPYTNVGMVDNAAWR